jgi:hypothetical protein
MTMKRLGWDPSMEDDGSTAVVVCRDCDNPFNAADYAGCPACYQGPGTPPPPDAVPWPIEEERTERIERETNADVVSRGLL